MRSQFNYLSSDCDTPKKLKEIVLAKIEKDTTTSTKIGPSTDGETSLVGQPKSIIVLITIKTGTKDIFTFEPKG